MSYSDKIKARAYYRKRNQEYRLRHPEKLKAIYKAVFDRQMCEIKAERERVRKLKGMDLIREIEKRTSENIEAGLTADRAEYLAWETVRNMGAKCHGLEPIRRAAG